MPFQVTLTALILLCSSQAYAQVVDNNRLDLKESNFTYTYAGPAAGKWAAIYSQEFAQKYHLPPEGVSPQLDDSIEYLEVAVENGYHRNNTPHPDNDPDIDCYVNILAKKAQNTSLHPVLDKGEAEKRLYDQFDNVKKPIHAVPTASKSAANFVPLTNTIGSNIRATYSKNLLAGYDYFSVKEYKCLRVTDALRNKGGFSYTDFPLTSDGRSQTVNVPYDVLNRLYAGTPLPPAVEGQKPTFGEILKAPLLLLEMGIGG